MTTKAKAKGAPKTNQFAMNVELPEEAKEFAAKSVDQAQAAFDKAGELAHSNVQAFDASANAFKNNAAELQLKAIEFAQANLNSMFKISREMLASGKPESAIEAGNSFASDMGQTMLRQVTELNSLTVKIAREAAQPVQESAAKSVEELKKNFSS